MYVCVCHRVTDGQIREAVCEGACSMRDLRAHLNVGSSCGRCADCARQVLREMLMDCSTEEAIESA